MQSKRVGGCAYHLPDISAVLSERACLPFARRGRSAERVRVGGCAYHLPGTGAVRIGCLTIWQAWVQCRAGAHERVCSHLPGMDAVLGGREWVGVLTVCLPLPGLRAVAPEWVSLRAWAGVLSRHECRAERARRRMETRSGRKC